MEVVYDPRIYTTHKRVSNMYKVWMLNLVVRKVTDSLAKINLKKKTGNVHIS